MGGLHAPRVSEVLLVSEPRWEPPMAEPLYVTLRRAAEILDLPYWKVWDLTFCLDARYFGEMGGATRVSLASVKEYVELVEAGQNARQVLMQKYGPGQQSYTPRYSLKILRQKGRTAQYRQHYAPVPPRSNNYWKRGWWNR